MGALIDDDVLAAFAVTGETPADVAAEINSRFGDVITRLSFYAPYRADPDDVAALVAALRA
jgi:hypothetical protein